MQPLPSATEPPGFGALLRRHRLAAEQVFPVPPLALPPAVLPSLEELAQVEAVTLFLARTSVFSWSHTAIRNNWRRG